MEPTKKSRAVKSIASQLRKLANRADDLNLQLGNGAEVGALISSLAAELEVALEDGAFDRSA